MLILYMLKKKQWNDLHNSMLLVYIEITFIYLSKTPVDAMIFIKHIRINAYGARGREIIVWVMMGKNTEIKQEKGFAWIDDDSLKVKNVACNTPCPKSKRRAITKQRSVQHKSVGLREESECGESAV